MLCTLRNIFFVFVSTITLCSQIALSQGNVSGQYEALMLHDDTEFFQHARITLRAANNGNGLLVSANVRLYFGKPNSNEFLTFDFAGTPINLLTRLVSFRDEANDISLIGQLRDGLFEGEWYSTVVGRIGTFVAAKNSTPEPPVNGTLVTSLSGYYRGTFTPHPEQESLPENLTMSFVTTQSNSGNGPQIVISGNVRFYFGAFDSQEYEEIKFSDIQFNFYNRYMTAKTDRMGLTFKGTVSQSGIFEGMVFSDSLGELGNVKIEQVLRTVPQ